MYSDKVMDHFSNPRLSYFLEMSGTIAPFHNRKSFAKLFPEDLSGEVRRSLRKDRVKFRNANPAEIVEVLTSMNICNKYFMGLFSIIKRSKNNVK